MSDTKKTNKKKTDKTKSDLIIISQICQRSVLLYKKNIASHTYMKHYYNSQICLLYITTIIKNKKVSSTRLENNNQETKDTRSKHNMTHNNLSDLKTLLTYYNKTDKTEQKHTAVYCAPDCTWLFSMCFPCRCIPASITSSLLSYFLTLFSPESKILSKDNFALPKGMNSSCKYNNVIHPVGLLHVLSGALTCPWWHDINVFSLSWWLTVFNIRVVLGILSFYCTFIFFIWIKYETILIGDIIHFSPTSFFFAGLIKETTQMKTVKIRLLWSTAVLSVHRWSRSPQHEAEWN